MMMPGLLLLCMAQMMNEVNGTLGPEVEQVRLKDIDYNTPPWGMMAGKDDLMVMQKKAGVPGGPIYEVLRGYNYIKYMFDKNPEASVSCVVYKSTSISDACGGMQGEAAKGEVDGQKNKRTD